ncbi:MAG TPA: hypothetical protein VGM56_26850 [Byssovorax sp.]
MGTAAATERASSPEWGEVAALDGRRDFYRYLPVGQSQASEGIVAKGNRGGAAEPEDAVEQILKKIVNVRLLVVVLTFFGGLLVIIGGYEIMQLDKVKDNTAAVGSQVAGLSASVAAVKENVDKVRDNVEKARDDIRDLRRQAPPASSAEPKAPGSTP